MLLYRTKKMQKFYHNHKTYSWDGKNPFNNPELEILRLNHWKIVLNEFGYDRILKKTYVLVPLQEEAYFEKLSEDAKNEFFDVKNNGVDGLKFDFFVVNDIMDMSVPFIFHAHLGVRKWWFNTIVEKMFF